MRKRIVVSLIFAFPLLVTLMIGCATTKGDWDKAQRLDTVQSYQEFLSKHPESEFNTEAKSRIEQLKWEEAQKSNSIERYEKFSSEYPQSKFNEHARQRIEQIKREVIKRDWEKAQSMHTIQGYRAFLRKHPQNEFVSDANNKINQILENKKWHGWQIRLISVEKMKSIEQAYTEFILSGQTFKPSPSYTLSINPKNGIFLIITIEVNPRVTRPDDLSIGEDYTYIYDEGQQEYPANGIVEKRDESYTVTSSSLHFLRGGTYSLVFDIPTNYKASILKISKDFPLIKLYQRGQNK